MRHFRHEKENLYCRSYIVSWRDSRFPDIIDLKTNGRRDTPAPQYHTFEDETPRIS